MDQLVRSGAWRRWGLSFADGLRGMPLLCNGEYFTLHSQFALLKASFKVQQLLTGQESTVRSWPWRRDSGLFYFVFL